MNEHTNGRTDKWKDENYIPLGINARGIMILHKACSAEYILDEVSPSVFHCTSTPMETIPIGTCVET